MRVDLVGTRPSKVGNHYFYTRAGNRHEGERHYRLFDYGSRDRLSDPKAPGGGSGTEVGLDQFLWGRSITSWDSSEGRDDPGFPYVVGGQHSLTGLTNVGPCGPKGTDLEFGSLVLRVRREEAFVFYATYIAGEYDFLEPQPDDVVLDAGANIGDYTIKAAKAVGRRGKVVAVEPNPGILPYLEHNVRANHLDNVVIVRCALGDPGEGTLIQTADGGSVASSLVPPEGQSTIGRRVMVRSIDEIMRSLEIDHPDIIKMDIEGAEYSALSGYRLLSEVRMIAVELHGPDNLRNVPRLLLDHFELRYQKERDVWTRTMRNALRHPWQFGANELRSSLLASRRALGLMFGNSHPVPSVSPGRDLAILYGQNRQQSRPAPRDAGHPSHF